MSFTLLWLKCLEGFNEPFNYADDICVCFRMDFGQMALNLEKRTDRHRLKINTNKNNVVNSILPICVNDIEAVKRFIYLGSLVSTNFGIELDFEVKVSQRQHQTESVPW